MIQIKIFDDRGTRSKTPVPYNVREEESVNLRMFEFRGAGQPGTVADALVASGVTELKEH